MSNGIDPETVLDASQKLVTVQAQFTVTAPAAGAGFTRINTSGGWERLASLTFRATTSAVVANRSFYIEIQDGDALRLGHWACNQVQAASGISIYSFGLGDYNAITTALPRPTGPLPDLWIPPGWRWALVVVNIDVGDQIDLIRGISHQRFIASKEIIDAYPEKE